jgi:ceramide kinase
VSPGTHLGDGNTDLILVRKTGRLNYFRYLYRTGYQRSNPFDLPFVEVHRVRQFSFSHVGDCCSDENDNGDGGQRHAAAAAGANCRLSVWNVDGEILPAANITVKVHKQIVPVFCRGPEEVAVSARNEIKPVDSGFKGESGGIIPAANTTRLL